jgi:hypothetical protein
VSSIFRRFSSNTEDSWLTSKELVDLLKGGRGVGSAAFISQGEREVAGY